MTFKASTNGHSSAIVSKVQMPGQQYRKKAFAALVAEQDWLGQQEGRMGPDLVVKSRLAVSEKFRLRDFVMKSIEDEGIRRDWLDELMEEVE